jgi:hydrogenase-4 component H
MKIIPKMLSDVLRNILRPTNTVQYPAQKVKTPERFRGMIEITDACVACGACAAACPAKCIKFDRKSLSYWLPHCIFCGRCADVCPVDSVKFTHNYEEAREDKELYAGRVYEMAKCTACGKETMPLVQKKYLIDVKKMSAELFSLCPECKVKKGPASPPKSEEKKEEKKEAEKPKEKEEKKHEQEGKKQEENKSEQKKEEKPQQGEKKEEREEKLDKEKKEDKQDKDEILEKLEDHWEDKGHETSEEEEVPPSHEDLFGGVEQVTDFEEGEAPPWVRRK